MNLTSTPNNFTLPVFPVQSLIERREIDISIIQESIHLVNCLIVHILVLYTCKGKDFQINHFRMIWI